MTPEEQARQIIDSQLSQAGWAIQDYGSINLNSSLGIAVREYPTDSSEVKSQKSIDTFKMIKELNDIIQRPPYLLTMDRLWFAYDNLNDVRVKGKSIKRTLTDIISLLRFELGIDSELNPYSDIVNRNFKEWIFKKNAGHVQFSDEQTEWLRMIKDHIVSSVNIEKNDFDNTPFAEHGGLQKVWKLFGNDLDTILEELNLELVA